MSEEVLSCLLGRIPSMLPRVVLKNHSRHPVRDRVYPGVIPCHPSSLSSSSSSVEGVLLFDLSPLEIKLLDYFEEEGIDYKRTDVQVQIPDVDTSIQSILTENTDSNGSLETQAYIWCKHISTLDLTKDWDYANFRQQHLDWYLSSTVKPCRVEAENAML